MEARGREAVADQLSGQGFIPVRIEEQGAYANLTLGPALARARLSQRDAAFATDLVYGCTRLRRACDFVVDRFDGPAGQKRIYLRPKVPFGRGAPSLR